METLKPYKMILIAWHPLSHGDKNLIQELAKKYHKSNAQIILRWYVQKGNIVIPGSSNSEHIKSNFAFFDFELASDEMLQITKLDNKKKYYENTDAKEESYASMSIDFDN